LRCDVLFGLGKDQFEQFGGGGEGGPVVIHLLEQRLVPPVLHGIGQTLRQELARTMVAIKRITGHRELLANNPVLRRSIDVRNPYVDPLHLVQVELLRRLRETEGDERVGHALLVTINGIAAGMRNTG